MEKIKEMLQKNYGLDASSIEKINVSSTNSLFKIEDKNKNRFFLKKLFLFDRLTEDKIRSQIEIVKHLSSKNMPTIIPIKNLKEDELTKVGDDFYLLYPFFDIDDSSKANEEHFQIAAETLALFHNAMQDFEQKCPFFTKPMHTATDDITFFTEFNEHLNRDSVISRAKAQNNAFSQKILESAEIVKAAIIKVLHNLKFSDFTKETMLHYDFNKENLFFSEGRLLAVSDFDYSHKGFIESDLAKAAKYWSENKENASIDIEKFKKFIAEYCKHNPASQNWKFYHALVLYVALRRLIYAADYTLEKKADIEFLFDYDLKMIKFLMENEDKFKN